MKSGQRATIAKLLLVLQGVEVMPAEVLAGPPRAITTYVPVLLQPAACSLQAAVPGSAGS